MRTGHIGTLYRIDELIPHTAAKGAPESEWKWNAVWPVPGGSGYGHEDHSQAEVEYERMRNQHPTATLRLVAMIEHAERCGHGRVYD